MNLYTLTTPESRARGVLGRNSIRDEDLFLFLDTSEGAGFHMQRVPFGLAIAFLDKDFSILSIERMKPEHGRATAPARCAYAVEAVEDYFERHSLKAGDLWTALWTRAQTRTT